MAVGDTYEVVFQTQLEQRIFLNVFHFEQTVGADTPRVAEILAETFNLNVLATWITVVADAFSFQCVTARRVLPSPDIPGVKFQLEDTTGFNAGDPLPAHNALVIKLLTDNTNPKHNGRIFVTGITENFMLNGLWDAIFLSTVVAALRAKLILTLVAAGPDDQEFKPVVLNKFDSGAPIIPPTTSNITGTTASGLVFRQKRRLTKQTQVGATVI